MARYQCRKEAALRRLRLRPMPTPQRVIDVMKAQQHEVQDLEAESERLMEKLELKTKPVKAKKPMVKPMPKAKPVQKPKDEDNERRADERK